jgi:hypothetical protein
MNKDDITNNNKLNQPSDDAYKSFNDFIFSEDIKLAGKLLHRYNFFLKTRELPGDIVEIGVFKGSGIMTFLKFIKIFSPNSNKKVIGFDIFNSNEAKHILEKDSQLDKSAMLQVYDRVECDELSLESVKNRIAKSGIENDKFILVPGDVEQTLPDFLEKNPGFRISMLYIDVDIERPTYISLKYLWDRILPGGFVIFDEFEYHRFSESNGLEKFLKERNMDFDVKSTDWIAPTAFILKKSF